MKNKTVAVSLLGMLLSFALCACKRESGVVHAESDQATAYQPRQPIAPDSPEGLRQKAKNDRRVTGQLLRVDTAANTFTLIIDNGVEQTFRIDNTTLLNGTSTNGNKAKPAQNTNRIKELIGKEGHDVEVEWEGPSGPKLAMSVAVK